MQKSVWPAAVPAGCSTPQRGSNVQVTPMRTPVRTEMPPPAPMTPARQKVLANWQPPPSPSTPMKTSELSVTQMKDLAVAKKLGSLTVPLLKQFLKEQGKKVGGNKNDLISRIEGLFI